MTTTANAPAQRARIGRQAIHDCEGSLVGYGLQFSVEQLDVPESPRDADLRACEVMRTAFGDFGLDRMGHRRNLFVNLTRAFATGAEPMPFGPQNVVLDVLEELDVDAALVEGVRTLKERGYRLSVDANVSGDAVMELLPLVDVIKVDVSQLGEDLADLDLLVDHIRALVPQSYLLAERIADQAVLDRCRDAGFDMYSGHSPRPETSPAAGVRPSQLISLQLLAALSDPGSSLSDLERIVSADPGLSLRVLGTVNSAAGAGREIASLRQALVLLGRRSLSAWVMLAALGGQEDGQREQMIDVLTRARACELLSDHVDGLTESTAYAAGLLSGVVDIMGADARQVARESRLGEEMTAALVHRVGPAGLLLRAVEEFDRTGQTVTDIPSSDISRAQLHALGTAVATIDSILGQPA